MKKAYVVGNNVKTSLSPTIFQYWFKKYNIDGEYGYLEFKNDKIFEKKIIEHILFDNGLVGFNITIPYKEKIISTLNRSTNHNLQLSNHAANIGAINFLNLTRDLGPNPMPGGLCWSGDNTDIRGFEKSLKKQKKLKKGKAIVIGFGGASKAIIYSLVLQGFNEIHIFNRNFEKLISGLNNWSKKLHIPQHVWNPKPHKLEDLKKHTNKGDLIVNTTPVNVLEDLPNWEIGPKTTGFDIVYNPRGGTGFLKHFKPNKRIEGIQMLVYQAVPCFKMWFGVEPEIDEELFDVLYKKMDKKK